jgi:O-antigen ligase
MGPHNMYLESLAETGFLGFAALMAMAGVTLRRLWQVRRYWKFRNPEYAHNATSLLLAVIVFMVTGLFLHLAYGRYFWLLLALSGATYMVYRPEETEETSVVMPETSRPRKASPRFVVY